MSVVSPQVFLGYMCHVLPSKVSLSRELVTRTHRPFVAILHHSELSAVLPSGQDSLLALHLCNPTSREQK